MNPQQLLLNWYEALATDDPRKVAALYAADAVLVPTLSPEIRTSSGGIRDYFQEFLEKTPRGETLELHRQIGEHRILLSGKYRFSFGDGTFADARFSFLFVNREGLWKIVHHHSSLIPE